MRLDRTREFQAERPINSLLDPRHTGTFPRPAQPAATVTFGRQWLHVDRSSERSIITTASAAPTPCAVPPGRKTSSPCATACGSVPLSGPPRPRSATPSRASSPAGRPRVAHPRGHAVATPRRQRPLERSVLGI